MAVAFHHLVHILLPAQLLSSASELAPFIQEAAKQMSNGGMDYSSQLRDWSSKASKGSSSSSSSSSSASSDVRISLPDAMSQDRQEEESSEEQKKEEGEDKDGDKKEGNSWKDKKQESLDSIWNSHKEKIAYGKNAAAATLCQCGQEEKGDVCCAGARQYSSK